MKQRRCRVENVLGSLLQQQRGLAATTIGEIMKEPLGWMGRAALAVIGKHPAKKYLLISVGQGVDGNRTSHRHSVKRYEVGSAGAEAIERQPIRVTCRKANGGNYVQLT